MNLPILISNTDRRFSAVLVGAPDISAAGATREEAIGELRRVVRERINRGELAELDFDEWLDLAGAYSDDSTLDDICAEAYQARDEEVVQ